MEKAGAKSKAALGFLTVLEHPQQGLFGGYLLLNAAGRPLEFHCTAPVKANRAQEILYGPTLEPFLYGEQIGQTLLSKAKAAPLVVCTDRTPVLAVRQHVETPVTLVLSESQGDQPPPQPTSSPPEIDSFWRIDPAHGGVPLLGFQLGQNRLAVAESCRDDRRLVAERIAALADSFDLAEPFGRIREAIEEARRGRQAG